MPQTKRKKKPTEYKTVMYSPQKHREQRSGLILSGTLVGGYGGFLAGGATAGALAGTVAGGGIAAAHSLNRRRVLKKKISAEEAHRANTRASTAGGVSALVGGIVLGDQQRSARRRRKVARMDSLYGATTTATKTTKPLKKRFIHAGKSFEYETKKGVFTGGSLNKKKGLSTWQTKYHRNTPAPFSETTVKSRTVSFNKGGKLFAKRATEDLSHSYHGSTFKRPHLMTMKHNHYAINRNKAVLAGATVAALGGGSYYYYRRRKGKQERVKNTRRRKR